MKENQVLESYVINKETMALLPAREIDYDTIVIEKHQKLFVKETPINIIETACKEAASTYEGRRIATTERTGIQKRVPIPINRFENIYAFPTHSPTNFECKWIFLSHIRSSEPHVKSTKQTSLTFHNNHEITLPVSPTTIERQIHRTAYCAVCFSPR
ncbi:competence protein ComK [Texcoconibacillus texcoconensis]|uniref:Competence protein ComK n=1 Tax=Texcoconibacillus texcoconensis TaxID=1095777 RepID=A0A840QT55_9BACI|nr:competence protein ComK [Texcoconibacillus texcoconensis]